MEKTIHDPIYGTVVISLDILKFIDTPEFQRLRRIRQLGCCFLVFPSAQHSRFEHSIGVQHLVGKMMNHLKQKHPELNISERKITLMQIAGLMHDIGHACFSHAFDEAFIKPHGLMEHEERSCIIVRKIAQRVGGYDKQEIDFICSLINPSNKNIGYEYQVLANKENGLDCDKFDYIRRDAYHLGLPANTVEIGRLIQGARIIDNNICYPEKDRFVLYEFYRARYRMHRMVYQHHAVQAIELMIMKAITISNIIDNNVLKDLDKNIGSFLKYTDDIIYYFKNVESRQLIKRIECRNLFTMVKEFDSHEFDSHEFDSHEQSNDINLQNERIVKKITMGYNGSNTDPIKNIWFYSSKNPSKCFRTKNNHGLLPNIFTEDMIRIYTENDMDVI